MDIWTILEIEATKDTEEIRQAYRKKLKTVNPEDDPEAFMELRSAYEAAMKAAEQSAEVDEAEPASENPQSDSVIMQELDDLYQDYARRIQAEEWHRLFETDPYQALETEETVLDECLRYIAGHYNMPREVFRAIVKHFDLVGRKQELSERYPENLLDYLIYCANTPDAIDYQLFEGNLSQVDTYIRTYHRMVQHFNREETEEAEKCLDELNAMNIRHPYLDMMKLKLQAEKLSETENTEENLPLYQKAEEILKRYPEDFQMQLETAELAVHAGEYERAVRLLQAVLKQEPGYYPAMKMLGDARFAQKEYEAARDVYMDILEKYSYADDAYIGMVQANQKIIEKNLELLQQNPEDHKAAFEVAWSYYRNGEDKSAVEALNRFRPDADEEIQYWNVKGRSLLFGKQYEAALNCLLRWKEILEEKKANRGEDFSEDLDKQLCRLPYVHNLIARCYLNLGNMELAEQYLELPVHTERKEQSDAYAAYCQLLYQKKEYEACIQAGRKLLQLGNWAWEAYDYIAKSCFELNHLQECIRACGQAEDILPYQKGPYVLEIRMFQEVEQYEDAQAVIDRYRQLVPDSDSMCYYEAVNQRAQGQDEAALRLLETLRKNYNSATSDLDDYMEMLLMLADLYDEADRDRESIACYLEATALQPEHNRVHGYLGYMYRKTGDYPAAITEYTKQLALTELAFYYINRGSVYRSMREYEAAVADYKRGLELEPDNASCYMELGEIRFLERDYDEAIRIFELAETKLDEDEVRKRLQIQRYIARCYTCRYQYDQATAILKPLLEKYGDKADGNLRYELALNYTRADRFREAEAVLRDYLEHGTEAEDRFWFGCLLMELAGEEGDTELARSMYHQLLQMHSELNEEELTRLNSIYGRVMLLNGCYQEARTAYEQAVDLNKESSQNYYSELLESIYRLEGSVTAYPEYIQAAEGVRSGMMAPREYIRLARLYRVLEQYEKALECLEQAVRMHVCDFCGYCGCEEGYFEQGLVYEAMEDYEKAEAAFQKSLVAHGHCGIYQKHLDAMTEKNRRKQQDERSE